MRLRFCVCSNYSGIKEGDNMIVMLQVIGLTALSVASFAIFSLLLGIHTLNKRLDTILFNAGMLLLITSINALFFAGWVVVFNLFCLYRLHTFRSSFQTPHFAVYFFVVMLLVKPLSILMEKAVNFINEWQWKSEEP